MTNYMLRTLMISEDVDNTVLAWIKKAAKGGYCVVKHNADKEDASPHWHAWFTSDKKMQALRVDFKKGNEKHVGNGSYAMKECKDPEAYLRYMCHADGEGCEVDVVAAYGVDFTPEWFREQNKAFYVEQRKVTKERKIAARARNLYQVLLQECKDLNITSRESICHRYVAIWQDLEMGTIQVHQMRGVVNAVWLRVDTVNATEAIVEECLSRI